MLCRPRLISLLQATLRHIMKATRLRWSQVRSISTGTHDDTSWYEQSARAHKLCGHTAQAGDTNQHPRARYIERSFHVNESSTVTSSYEVQ